MEVHRRGNSTGKPKTVTWGRMPHALLGFPAPRRGQPAPKGWLHRQSASASWVWPYWQVSRHWVDMVGGVAEEVNRCAQRRKQPVTHFLQWQSTGETRLKIEQANPFRRGGDSQHV